MFRRLLSKRLIIRYLQVGVISVLANFLFFVLAKSLMGQQKSDSIVLSISTAFAVVFAFYMQSTYVWETGYRDARAGIKFVFLNLFSFGLNIVLLKALTTHALPAISAQAVSLMCIAAISFIFQKKWIFSD